MDTNKTIIHRIHILQPKTRTLDMGHKTGGGPLEIRVCMQECLYYAVRPSGRDDSTNAIFLFCLSWVRCQSCPPKVSFTRIEKVFALLFIGNNVGVQTAAPCRTKPGCINTPVVTLYSMLFGEKMSSFRRIGFIVKAITYTEISNVWLPSKRSEFLIQYSLLKLIHRVSLFSTS